MFSMGKFHHFVVCVNFSNGNISKVLFCATFETISTTAVLLQILWNSQRLNRSNIYLNFATVPESSAEDCLLSQRIFNKATLIQKFVSLNALILPNWTSRNFSIIAREMYELGCCLTLLYFQYFAISFCFHKLFLGKFSKILELTKPMWPIRVSDIGFFLWNKTKFSCIQIQDSRQSFAQGSLKIFDAAIRHAGKIYAEVK